MKHGLLSCLLFLSCVHRGPVDIARPVSRPSYSAVELMNVCWPEDAAPTERVRLSFERTDGVLRQVFFEALDGAANSTARCMRQVAVSFPWGWNEVPERLELTPPGVAANGWVILAFHELVSHGLPENSNGLERPSELVAACLANGSVRPSLRFNVQPAPVRVSLWVWYNEGWRETSTVLPSERCVAAVLASTAFSTRSYTLNFSEESSNLSPAPKSEVSFYFPKETFSRGLIIEPALLAKVMQSIKPKVEACWNSALERRWGIGGGRTFRWRVGEKGVVEHVWVDENLSDSGTEFVDYLFDRCLSNVLKDTPYSESAGPFEGLYSWVFANR